MRYDRVIVKSFTAREKVQQLRDIEKDNQTGELELKKNKKIKKFIR